MLLAVSSTLLSLFGIEVVCRGLEWRDSARRSARTRVHYAVELATREGKPLTDEPGSVRLQLDPALGFRLAPDRDAPGIRIGPLGLRGAPFSRAKPPGTYRIVLTGGSVAFGWGASGDEACVAPKLAALLSTPERPVEVLNAGCPAYSFTQEFLWVSVELLDYEPDLVISLTGHNDIDDAFTGSGLISHELLRQIELRLAENRRLGPSLLHATALGRRLVQKFSRSGPVAQPPEELAARESAAAARFANMVARLGALAPGQVLVALQPSYLCCPPGSRPTAEANRVEDWMRGYYQERASAYAAFHERMRAVERQALVGLEATGNRGVDLGDALVAVPEPAFTDVVHLTDAGNARLAERLAEAVRTHPAWCNAAR